MRNSVSFAIFVTAGLFTLPSRTAAQTAHEIRVDPASGGKVFEGLGALSAGASSRLLLDYPEPARSQVLDYLFKPMFGASFHHLKVEIGGDVNSTDGTEASFARTRDEFDHPRPEYFDRGYEWWLMKEAKARNPRVFLDILQWGAPPWIGAAAVPATNPATLTWEQRVERNRRQFYTQDNADFIAAFIKGGKTYHGLDIDFCGIWNETHYDVEWIKLLRGTLDRAGLGRVRIIAADQSGPRPWEIAKDMLKDPALSDAVYAIGAHYPGMVPKTEPKETWFNAIPEAKQTGKPLWSSEDGPWRGDWQGAGALARLFNRNYIVGRMTKTIIWSLVSSYYDSLPMPGSGPMKALTPWSGHYEVQPALWAIAHTTQFAQPGWKYVDSACTILPDPDVSCIALQSPDGRDCSLVVESCEATAPCSLAVRLAGDLHADLLHVWRTTEQSWFDRQPDIAADNGVFHLTIAPNAIYSLTTTTGQRKGAHEPPPAKPFPFPYQDDFEQGRPGKYAKYFSDQGGLFEIAPRPDGNGQALQQVIDTRGIDWNGHPTPQPYTVIGATDWRNYEVSCDAWAASGSVAVFGRIVHAPQNAMPPEGYWLRLDTDGRWNLLQQSRILAYGQTTPAASRWRKLALRFAGPSIEAFVDGVSLASVEDLTYAAGQAGLGTGWNTAFFDDFTVRPIDAPAWTNYAAGAKATASSRWDKEYDARFAVDGVASSRWNSANGTAAGEWIEIDFGRPVRFDRVLVRQFASRIRGYKLQYLDGGQWRDAYAGEREGEPGWMDRFDPVVADRLRLLIVSTAGGTPSIYELEVYGAPPAP